MKHDSLEAKCERSIKLLGGSFLLLTAGALSYPIYDMARMALPPINAIIITILAVSSILAWFILLNPAMQQWRRCPNCHQKTLRCVWNSTLTFGGGFRKGDSKNSRSGPPYYLYECHHCTARYRYVSSHNPLSRHVWQEASDANFSWYYTAAKLRERADDLWSAEIEDSVQAIQRNNLKLLKPKTRETIAAMEACCRHFETTKEEEWDQMDRLLSEEDEFWEYCESDPDRSDFPRGDAGIALVRRGEVIAKVCLHYF